MVKVQCGEDTYRLVCGSAEGDLVEYGEVAEVEAGGHRYIALVDLDDKSNVESLLGEGFVYRVDAPEPHEIEDVEFEEEGDDGDEEDDEEEETVEAGADGDTAA